MTQQEVLFPNRCTSGIKGRFAQFSAVSVTRNSEKEEPGFFLRFVEIAMAEEPENVYINVEESSVNLSR